MLTDADLNRDDRKRLRRASKASRNKERKSDAAKLKEEARVSGKEYNPKTYGGKDNLSSDKRVVTGENESATSGKLGKSNNYTKSSQFFSNLQQQTQSEICEGKVSGKRKFNSKTETETIKVSSASFKL